MMNEVEHFLSQFRTAKGESPEALVARARHWLAIAGCPAESYPDATEYELRCRARQARQNARRLLRKHPELLAALQNSGSEQVVQ